MDTNDLAKILFDAIKGGHSTASGEDGLSRVSVAQKIDLHDVAIRIAERYTLISLEGLEFWEDGGLVVSSTEEMINRGYQSFAERHFGDDLCHAIDSAFHQMAYAWNVVKSLTKVSIASRASDPIA